MPRNLADRSHRPLIHSSVVLALGARRGDAAAGRGAADADDRGSGAARAADRWPADRSREQRPEPERLLQVGNLLAHSDLYAAGIARSGAYNRSLTPFGFQAEQQTFWEAPEVYFAMSPFMNAEAVDEPILMIHGAEENNSGTFPIQSERMYHALKRLGATARLVMLPEESHGYRARESLLHMLWEQNEWLKRWVSPGPETELTTTD